MQLRFCTMENTDHRVISEEPTVPEVEAFLLGTNWNEFSFVDLYRDEDNWLDGSGCLPSDGLAVMLSVDGIQYVSEVAPASAADFLPYFKAYMAEDWHRLFELIYDVVEQQLSVEELAKIRHTDDAPQRQRLAEERIADAASLFSEKRWGEFVASVEPFAEFLSLAQQRKLELARTRMAKSDQA